MAVSRAEKDEEFGQLQAAFREAETAVLVDYRGITVPQVTELRRQIRASGARYRVVKNSLAKRAAAGTSFEVFSKEFKGPTAVVYTGRDPVAMAKALTTFVKTAPSMTIKAAVVQGRAVSAGAVTDLASLPSKPELYASPAVGDAGAGAAARHRAVGAAARSCERALGRRAEVGTRRASDELRR